MHSIDDPRVQDLLKPRNLPGDSDRVEFRFTHGSLVFLTEDSAYKVKRAKDYGFFDYSDLESRRHYCEEEVRLNRRAAPRVYLGVLPVYRDRDGYSMTRPGDIVDYAVHMRRLPDDRSALGLLTRGQLGEDEILEIARRAAHFYSEATALPPDPDALRTNIEENFRQVAPFVGDLIDEETFDWIRGWQQRWLDDHADELAGRACRDGHGDLRLEHVYLLPGEGVIFLDCIEFLDRFRIADPALDAAFFAMDLSRLGHADLAESFIARFARASDDYDLYRLVDGYMSYRAFVRAKVAAFVARDPDTGAEVVARKRAEAEQLFRLAREISAASASWSPRMIAVGGIIASGKTTVAELIARHVHAPVVSADETRKRLAGLDTNERGDAESYAGIYAPSFSDRVQSEVLRRARAVLDSGRSVILDTTFQKRRTRDQARALASSERAPFLMVECRVPEAETRRRLRDRSGGVSDAREDLLEDFTARFEPIDELPADELVALDTTRPEQDQIDALASGGVLPSTACENT